METRTRKFLHHDKHTESTFIKQDGEGRLHIRWKCSTEAQSGKGFYAV